MDAAAGRADGPLRFHCEYAWLGGERAVPDVLVTVCDRRITAVDAGVPAPRDAHRLPGMTLPGLVNTHSHVFHRAIRGHAQSGVADFWAWREVMYAAAAALDPDLLYRLALATYAEMALSGITAVGEFFYLHHGPDGRPYDDPNAMGRAVMRAAADAGIRITLLDTCYLQADIDAAPLRGVQLRFGDGSSDAWMQRVESLRATDPGPRCRIGAAIHSVRAVPRAAAGVIADYARDRGLPLHAHVSEQPAENAACLQAFGMTPVALLDAAGAWGPSSTAVHATHLTDGDMATLGARGTAISMCCTTERNLADGPGHAIALAAAGSPLCVGSDGHAVIDLLEEGRAIELNERLRTGRRGHLTAGQIAQAVTAAGAASIGWDAGRIEVGAAADLTTVDLDSVRTAGARSGDVLAHTVFAATAADVRSVIVGGSVVVADGVHLAVPHTGRELAAVIAQVMSSSRPG
jgi:formiminoglutamate deiminase